MSEIESVINYYLRRELYNQVLNLCTNSPTHAIYRSISHLHLNAPGLAIIDLKELELKRDFQLIWPLVNIHAHMHLQLQKEIDTLKAKLDIAENGERVTETGYFVAGMFCYYMGEISNAERYLRLGQRKNANSIVIEGMIRWLRSDFGENYDDIGEEVRLLPLTCELLKLNRLIKGGLYEQSSSLLSTLIVSYPNFHPFKVEKMYVLVELAEWEEARGLAVNIDTIMPRNVDSLIVLALFSLTNEVSIDFSFLEESVHWIEQVEPENNTLLRGVINSLSSASRSDQRLLEICEKVLRRESDKDPLQFKNLLELGDLQLKCGMIERAYQSYAEASKVDSSSLEALLGTIHCMVREGQYEEAKEHLEMVKRLDNMMVWWLRGRVALSEGAEEEWLNCLLECVLSYLKGLRGRKVSKMVLMTLNCDFVVDVVEAYLESEVWTRIDNTSKLQCEMSEILKGVVGYVPGFTKAVKFGVRLEIIRGRFGPAKELLQGLEQVSLLLAEIHVEEKDYVGGMRYLERALSDDFSIRKDLQYLILKVRCLQGLGQDATLVLKSAFDLITPNSDEKGVFKGVSTGISQYQIVQLYTFNIRSPQTLQDTLQLFKGTLYEPHFTILHAQALLKDGHSESGLDVLESVKSVSIQYKAARRLMAGVCLKQSDTKRYVEYMYEGLEDTVDSYLKVATEFESLLMWEELEGLYRKGNERFGAVPFEALLGAYYTSIHEYSKAISYYRREGFQYELASLLFKLKRAKEAQEILQTCYKTDLKSMKLYAQVMISLQDLDTARTILEEAKVVTTSSDLTTILDDLGMLEELSRNHTASCDYYRQSGSEFSKLALASLLIKQNNHAEAQDILINILKITPMCIKASKLLASSLFDALDLQQAYYHYRQILQEGLDYDVMVEVILLARRLDRLDEIKLTDSQSIGFIFCAALLNYFMYNLKEAITGFATCRDDLKYGQRALRYLIEIFLIQITEFPDLEDLEIVEVFIEKVEPEILKRTLRCRLLIATSCEKVVLDSSIETLTEILTLETDYVPALYAQALTFKALKQSSKFKLTLKRITNLPWSREHGSDIDTCLILLSDHCIQTNKINEAKDLLKEVTKRDQASLKAHEYLGCIMEKENSYKDAAHCYLKCWSLQRNPTIGFKLAFNYLKAKEFTEAIDICHQVLKSTPSYPKIKVDILDKARASLRS